MPTKRVWWPIRLKFIPGSSGHWFRWHGWQIGINTPEYGQTFHFGPLKVTLGDDTYGYVGSSMYAAPPS
jgi:hypothetical protein